MTTLASRGSCSWCTLHQESRSTVLAGPHPQQPRKLPPLSKWPASLDRWSTTTTSSSAPITSLPADEGGEDCAGDGVGGQAAAGAPSPVTIWIFCPIHICLKRSTVNKYLLSSHPLPHPPLLLLLLSSSSSPLLPSSSALRKMVCGVTLVSAFSMFVFIFISTKQNKYDIYHKSAGEKNPI